VPKIVDHAERRLHIARAACRCIGSNGLDRVRLRDVAAEAGCTTGAIAHYFASKEDLLFAALDVTIEEATARLQAHVPEALDTLTIDALVEQLMETLPTSEERYRDWRIYMSIWVLAISDARAAERTRANYELLFGLVADSVRRLAPDLDLADTALETASWEIIALVDGLGIQACLAPHSWPAERLRRHVQDGVVALLGLQPAATTVR
jgi:AcrR family transcriptional regulator